MDPALLREREAFKKRAMQMPTVEKRRSKPDSSAASRPSKKPKHASAPKPKDTSSSFNYKTMQGSSQYKFSVLAKIVKYMRTRHQEGETHFLTIDEILDETNQLDVGPKHKQWLLTEALVNNPKIQVEGEKFKFKPKHNIRDKKGLIRLLDKNDQRGIGGIYKDDVEEALPNAQRAMKILGDQIIYVTRSVDKKQVLFYNDKNYQFTVDEEIVKLWRSVAVDNVDEGKIEEYLDKQGITSMSNIGLKKVTPVQKRKKGGKKNRSFKKHNDHMGDILQDYVDK